MTLTVLVGAAIVVVALLVSGRLTIRGLPGSPTVPPPDAVRLGESYDASTFAIAARWTAATIGRPIAAVAHLSRPITTGEATLRISVDGAVIAHPPLANLTGPGELIGFKFTPPDAGSYVFSIVNAAGANLAKATIAAS